MKISGKLFLGLFLLTLAVTSAAGAEPQRVLIVHSFGSTAPPFTIGSTAFATTLKREMGEPVDLDEVSLDMARYAQPDMEEPFADFLLKRLTKWRPDLVVPIGAPAGWFVAKYRDRLFPLTPVLYTGMDRRTLPVGALQKSATFVGEGLDLAGLVADILQLAPDSEHIAVVLGSSPLERYWALEARRAFEPFTNRVRFTWFNDLSFDQMLERAANLPARSFILFGLLIQDASGVTYNQDDALVRLRQVTNAPINGLYQNQLGLGIVGGRLYGAEAMGETSARIAIRILRGESISNFPALIVPPQKPRYDWRELHRWQIKENRLPPGSEVAFRQATVWQRYLWWIAGIFAIVMLEAGSIILLVVNLTKRRRVERALRQSQEQVNLAADSAGAGLWSLDPATRQMWATPRLRELLQLGAVEQLTYDTFLRVVHPQDRDEVRQFFERVAQTGARAGIEFRTVASNGSQRWIVTRGHLDADGRGGGQRWRGSSVDITERKLAEERLRESEARFRTVADSAPVLLWMSGVDKLCTFFNQPWLDFTGRTAAQEMGNGWTEGVHPDDLPGCFKGYAEAFDARRPFVLQYRLRRHDGEYRWIMDNGVPRYDADGAFAGYIGSASDITERLQAEDRFRQVFEAAPNAMIMVAGNGRIVLVNAQVEKVFGYRREEIVGLPIETLIPEPFRRAHSVHRDRFAGDPRPRPMGAGRNLFGRRKDGSEVPVEIGLNPIRTVEGLFVVASVIDVTERRQAEAEAQDLRQELAHISRVATVGEMTAAIVHELSQPLTAILTNAQVGIRLITSPDQRVGEMRDILEDIVTDIRRADRVIQHLRLLFRKGEVERRPLPLNNVIDDVVSVVMGEARRRRVSIALDLAAGLPLVSGDRVQLQQVLLNLIVNAFEALGDVTGRERKITLRTRSLDEKHVQVDVTDNGPGIAAEKVASIFKPFVTTKPGGMGMGLSVSHSIVTAHQGRLWAENGPEGGAVFHMILPTMPSEQCEDGRSVEEVGARLTNRPNADRAATYNA